MEPGKWLLPRLVAGLLLLAAMAMADLVDIKPYYSLILEHHNNLRKSVSPQASDMREMMWDDGLARDAEDWSKNCRYQRPPSYMYDSGSNLFYQRKHVSSWHSIRANVQRGMQSWDREKQYFRYGTDCGTSCSYVQMIYSSTYRVGCAMNRCNQLVVGTTSERHSTLFLCFYAPRGKLIGTYPYRSGDPGSECPSGTRASEGLCVEGTGIVGSVPQNIAYPDESNQVAVRQPVQGLSDDALTTVEIDYVLRLHNMYRKNDNCPELQWDPSLKRWTDWIVNCKTDYPGPPHTYTSFARCPSHMPVYELVNGWHKEGSDVNIQLDGKGCRTPNDHTSCNHNTNMMQQRVTSMACSACNCGDGTRQLVCVYDNSVERRFRGY